MRGNPCQQLRAYNSMWKRKYPDVDQPHVNRGPGNGGAVGFHPLDSTVLSLGDLIEFSAIYHYDIPSKPPSQLTPNTVYRSQKKGGRIEIQRQNLFYTVTKEETAQFKIRRKYYGFRS